MTETQRPTVTREDPVLEDHDRDEQLVPRLSRFFRADAPCEGIEEFSLAYHEAWTLGRVDGDWMDNGEEARIFARDDALMSSRHATLTASGAGWEIMDAGSKNGTFVNGSPLCDRHKLENGDIVECGNSFFIYRDRCAGPSAHHTRAPSATRLLTLAPLHYQIEPLLPFVASSLSIHLHGETGTGKEVVARAIHDLSSRGGAFIARNCAAIPDALFESELFGHVKGAFSGASASSPGQIVAAAGGTLFLDEIGELSLPMQAKLLRSLELKEVLPIGATRPIPVDFRLVSATLCDLRTMVAVGSFRRDLFGRLGRTFTVPPVRAFKEHLGVLVPTLLAGTKLSSVIPITQVRFTIAAARAIVRYDWPLNVRELKQCIEGALTSAAADGFADTCTIEKRHLPPSVWASSDGMPLGRSPTRSFDARATRMSPADDVLEALRRAGGNRADAAKLLGVSERTLFRRIRKLRADGTDV